MGPTGWLLACLATVIGLAGRADGHALLTKPISKNAGAAEGRLAGPTEC